MGVAAGAGGVNKLLYEVLNLSSQGVSGMHGHC